MRSPLLALVAIPRAARRRRSASALADRRRTSAVHAGARREATPPASPATTAAASRARRGSRRYFKLTPAQKDRDGRRFRPLHDQGASASRWSSARSPSTSGEHPANALRRPRHGGAHRAQLRALTSLARRGRADDKFFRACGLIGQLVRTPSGRPRSSCSRAAEQRCAQPASARPTRFACAPRLPRPRSARRSGRCSTAASGRAVGGDVAQPAGDLKPRERHPVHRQAFARASRS